jgi:hypothetical protein
LPGWRPNYWASFFFGGWIWEQEQLAVAGA